MNDTGIMIDLGILVTPVLHPWHVDKGFQGELNLSLYLRHLWPFKLKI